MNLAQTATHQIQLLVRHQQLAINRPAGRTHDLYSTGVRPIQQQFFRERQLIRIGDKVFAFLSVQIVVAGSSVQHVIGDGNAIRQFSLKVGVYQHTHRCCQMINSIKFSFVECSVIP